MSDPYYLYPDFKLKKTQNLKSVSEIFQFSSPNNLGFLKKKDNVKPSKSSKYKKYNSMIRYKNKGRKEIKIFYIKKKKVDIFKIKKYKGRLIAKKILFFRVFFFQIFFKERFYGKVLSQ